MTYQPPQDPWQPVPPPPPPPPSSWQTPTAQFGPVPPYPTAQVPAAGQTEAHGWVTVPVGVDGGNGPKRRITRGQKIAGGFLGLLLLCCCGGGIAAIGNPGDDKPATKESAAAARALAEPSVAQDSPAPSSEPPTVAPTSESPSPAATTSRPSPAPKPTRSSPKPTPKRTTSAPRTTKPTTSKCDPNYSGCVPIASDVDCAGGSGNGPAYVQGPVRVIGTDIYDLDRDGDGIACDK
ncbi:hypothetical protein ONA91_17845 [Micromonospora sp. DR5-3]|uniref:hypothetical protein n=1 Tax=unclassified Micromonospora TaxID=2617518 RepID=UPI0021067A0F|nr:MULTISPECIES: hypothetical protein [unclassified Micromonospora]MCW3816310.1 hypothetical protein [Micromonospora sp. DR5-3]